MPDLRSLVSALALAAPLAVGACADLDLGDATAGRDEAAELTLEWVLLVDDRPASCVDAGAAELELGLYFADRELTERVSCFGGFAAFEALPAGQAAVELVLLGPDGTPRMSADLGIVELRPGATTPLGAIELTLDP